MSKLTFKESSLLIEARRGSLKYDEKKVKDKIDRVITELEGTESATMSKLAGKYKRLEQALKRMSAKRDELKDKLKTDMAGLFDPEDIVLTRVVETVSFTLTLSKSPMTKDKTDINYEAIANALTKLIDKSLEPKIEEITKAYTKFTPGGEFKVSPSIDVDAKIAESMFSVSGIRSKVMQWLKSFQNSFASWAIDYDNQFKSIRDMMI